MGARGELLIQNFGRTQSVDQGIPSVFLDRPLTYGKLQGVVLFNLAKVQGVSKEGSLKRFGLHSLSSGGCCRI